MASAHAYYTWEQQAGSALAQLRFLPFFASISICLHLPQWEMDYPNGVLKIVHLLQILALCLL